MASYRTVKSVYLSADGGPQDQRIMVAANAAAKRADEPVGALVRRLLEVALGIRRGS